MVIEARNHTKIRVLLYLRDRLLESQESADDFGGAWCWRAPATIAFDTGVNAASLYVIMKRWRENTWGYADARYFSADQMTDGRPHWLYRINAKGLSYLNRLHKWYMAEDEVKAELAEYQREIGSDMVPWRLVPRCIAWHIKPSTWTTVINWPFASKHDTHPAKWFMKGYEVANIEEAVYTARAVFRIIPSNECIERAKAIQNHFVQEALEKLATGAGFVTTKEA